MSERRERWLANAFAFVMTFLLLLFIQQATADELHRPEYTESAIVVTHDTLGWHSRIAKVRSHANFVPAMCFELPGHRSAQCFYMDGEKTLVIETQLIGEERT